MTYAELAVASGAAPDATMIVLATLAVLGLVALLAWAVWGDPT